MSSEKNNIKNIPNINCLTLKKSNDRQNYIINNTKKYNLTVDFTYGYDGINDDIIIEGNFLDKMKLSEISCSISHLKMIKKWVDSTNDQYGFFCEDDVDLSNSDYWFFDWCEFIHKLPENWGVIQLTIVRDNFNEHNTILHNYTWDNWSTCSYIMSKDYAKKLINQHLISNNKYNLNLPHFPHTIPYAENLLYNLTNKVGCYSIPLFLENIFFNSNIRVGVESINNIYSNNYMLEWWQTVGKNKNINYFIKQHNE